MDIVRYIPTECIKPIAQHAQTIGELRAREDRLITQLQKMRKCRQDANTLERRRLDAEIAEQDAALRQLQAQTSEVEADQKSAIYKALYSAADRIGAIYRDTADQLENLNTALIAIGRHCATGGNEVTFKQLKIPMDWPHIILREKQRGPDIEGAAYAVTRLVEEWKTPPPARIFARNSL